MGRLTADNKWSWYTQGELDQPALIRDHYRPGTDVNVAAGVYHESLTADAIRITPLLQLVGSWRTHDRDAEAEPENTAYTRLVVDPGWDSAPGSAPHCTPMKRRMPTNS
jgi:hypothetical protein